MLRVAITSPWKRAYLVIWINMFLLHPQVLGLVENCPDGSKIDLQKLLKNFHYFNSTSPWRKKYVALHLNILESFSTKWCSVSSEVEFGFVVLKIFKSSQFIFKLSLLSPLKKRRDRSFKELEVLSQMMVCAKFDWLRLEDLEKNSFKVVNAYWYVSNIPL